MEFSELEQRVKELNALVQSGVVFEIDEQHVDTATSILKAVDFKTAEDVVVALCSLNLLNAAIKMRKFKEKLAYRFIKSKAGSLLAIVDAHKIGSIAYFYNASEQCLYFKVGQVIFSFHQVPLTPHVLKASFCQPIVWGGIRLQKIAQPLFCSVVS